MYSFITTNLMWHPVFVMCSRGKMQRRGSGRLQPSRWAGETETDPAGTLPPGDWRAAPSPRTSEDVEATEGNSGLHLLWVQVFLIYSPAVCFVTKDTIMQLIVYKLKQDRASGRTVPHPQSREVCIKDILYLSCAVSFHDGRHVSLSFPLVHRYTFLMWEHPLSVSLLIHHVCRGSVCVPR